MNMIERHDPLSGILHRLEITIGAGWDQANFCGMRELQKIAVCPTCNKHNTFVAVPVARKTSYRCESCGSVFKRIKYRVQAGPNAHETRAKISTLTQPERSHYDPKLAYYLFGPSSPLSRGAQLWLLFADHSLSRSSRETYAELQNELLAVMLPHLPDVGITKLEQCLPAKKDQAEAAKIRGEIAKKLAGRIRIAKALIRAAARHETICKAELARLSGVNRSQFSSDRGWGSLESVVLNHIESWQNEMAEIDYEFRS